MPTDPYSAYKNSTAGSVTDRKYPNPFFDLANNSIPSNIKTLFKYCHAFFHTDPFLSNVVRKLTEYPITDILYDTNVDSLTREKYDRILHEVLKITSKLIEIGLDYYTYGNCFMSMFLKTRRYLRNTKTGEVKPIKDTKYVFRRLSFFILDEMNNEIPAEVIDEPIKSIEAIRFVR